MTGFIQDDRKVFSIKGVLGGLPLGEGVATNEVGARGRLSPLYLHRVEQI